VDNAIDRYRTYQCTSDATATDISASRCCPIGPRTHTCVRSVENCPCQFCCTSAARYTSETQRPSWTAPSHVVLLRKSEDRGYADHGWLKSRHSFSFADYYDPAHVSFGNLRVINEDRVAAGKGFGTHSHRDMEIISYVLEGELAHRDSMGDVEAIPPGDVQRMSAGSGVTHSEFNHAKDKTTHFLQIWILPNVLGIPPSYEQKTVPVPEKRGRLRLIASPKGTQHSVTIHADACVYAGLFNGSEHAELTLDPKRKAYVHVVRGELEVNGEHLEAGDAALLQQEHQIELANGADAEVLVFDLAA
jgi:quercetin 2,3-dioxygenase